MRRGLAILLAGFAAAAAERPVELNPQNPHYFQYRGRTTPLITSGEHYGAVLNADFDYRRYLDTLRSDGMNYTRIFGGSYVEVPAKSFGILRNTLAPARNRFLPPWARSGVKFDLNRWNPDYFARLHDFLAEASKRGIVVELTLFSSQYGDAQWGVSALNPVNNVNGTDNIDRKKLNTLENGNILGYQERYVRKLVREVNRHPNVIFEIANEPWTDRPVHADVMNPDLPLPQRNRFPNAVEIPDELAMRWQERVAGWIGMEESSLPNKHLIAQNIANFRHRVRSLIPGVSVVNFHYARPEAVSENYGLNKVISYDESGFLGRGDDVYTSEAWKFMLSGGGAFDGLDYSFSVGHEDGTDLEPNGPGGGSPEFRRRLRILSEFLRSFPLTEMAPDARTVKPAAGVEAYALSSAKGEYAIYLEGKNSGVVLNLPAGRYTVRWLDIESGKESPATAFRQAGGEKTLAVPAFRKGIAARLERTR
ncbi:MAG TPA: hypothetical protein VHD76_09425 [Bryobacteraceae bacterium]|nr:hypothetical protein [Bryobacteraceae bacterium]